MSDQPIQSHGPIVETSVGQHAAPDQGHAHASGVGKYIVVFILLCLLTSASFFTTSTWWQEHFSPQVSWAFMMAVSCTKAMLVILFFMHLLYEANWKFVLTIPAALMSIFLLLMLVPDIGMRGRWASEEKKFYQAEEKTEAQQRAEEKAGGEESSAPSAEQPSTNPSAQRSPNQNSPTTPIESAKP